MKHDDQRQAQNPGQLTQYDKVREKEYALPLFRREEQVEQPAAIIASRILAR
jgi:hypothetical protein